MNINMNNPFGGGSPNPEAQQAQEQDLERNLKKAGKLVLWVVLVLLLLGVLLQCFYTVDETEHAIKYRFSEIVQINVNNLEEDEFLELVNSPNYQSISLREGAGIFFKIPFVEKVERFENRLITYDTQPREVITLDKKKIILDNNAQWWIVDPFKFKITMNSINSANQRIEDLMYSKINEKVGRTTANQLISDKKYVMAMLDENTKELNVAIHDYGIRVADIQIKRTDLPANNNENIFNRMRTEREQMARQYRSEGKEEAQKIKSGADTEAAQIRAEANAEAQRIRGKGDADAAETFNKAYNRDPEFFQFYQTLETYKKTIKDSGGKIILPPDSDFAKYLYSAGVGNPVYSTPLPEEPVTPPAETNPAVP